MLFATFIFKEASQETPGFWNPASVRYEGVPKPKLKVANNITVIPSIFYLPETSQGANDTEQFGGVVQTVFKF